MLSNQIIWNSRYAFKLKGRIEHFRMWAEQSFYYGPPKNIAAYEDNLVKFNETNVFYSLHFSKRCSGTQMW